MWRLSRSRDAAARDKAARGEAAQGEATLTVELFGDRVPARDRDEIATEAARVLAFAAPQAASRDVRFVPVGPTGAD
jgi:hypothetical protein